MARGPSLVLADVAGSRVLSSDALTPTSIVAPPALPAAASSELVAGWWWVGLQCDRCGSGSGAFAYRVKRSVPTRHAIRPRGEGHPGGAFGTAQGDTHRDSVPYRLVRNHYRTGTRPSDQQRGDS